MVRPVFGLAVEDRSFAADSTPASGVSAMPLSIVNTVALSPMPSVSTPMTVSEKPRFLARARMA